MKDATLKELRRGSLTTKQRATTEEPTRYRVVVLTSCHCENQRYGRAIERRNLIRRRHSA